MPDAGTFDYFRAGTPIPVISGAATGALEYFRAGVPFPAIVAEPGPPTGEIAMGFGPATMALIGTAPGGSGAIAMGFGPPTMVMTGYVGTVGTVTGTIAMGFGPPSMALAGYSGPNSGAIAMGFGPPTMALTGYTFPPVYGPIAVGFGPPSMSIVGRVGSVLNNLVAGRLTGGFIVRVNGVTAWRAVVDSVTWSIPGTRQFGRATVFIPRTDPAFAAMADNRTFPVTLHGPVVGSMRGIAAGFQPNIHGAVLEVLSYEAFLDRDEFVVSWVGADLNGMSSAAYVRVAFMNAVAGKAEMPLTLGPLCESGPAIDGVDVVGKSFIQVVMDLTERTGMEHSIDHLRRFSWGPPRNRLYAAQLMDGGGISVILPNKVSFLNQTTAITTRTAAGHEQTARA